MCVHVRMTLAGHLMTIFVPIKCKRVPIILIERHMLVTVIWYTRTHTGTHAHTHERTHTDTHERTNEHTQTQRQRHNRIYKYNNHELLYTDEH